MISDKFKHNQKISRWITVLATPTLAMIAFVVTFWFDPLKYNQQPLASIPAFLLSVVILLVGQAITISLESHHTSEFSDRIYDAIKDYLHVTPIGSPEEALRYINSRIPSLREVKNTSLNTEDELERSTEKYYGTQSYLKMIELISYHCNRDLIWKDVGDILAVERLREIRRSCSRFTKERRDGYRFKILSNLQPQINFIILEYLDGVTEVLFNWDFRGNGQDPRVLISRDRSIVEMFAIQYAMLWKAGTEDHDSQATKSNSTK